MDNRKTITTAARLALWEAHGRKCAYTGEPIAWVRRLLEGRGGGRGRIECLDNNGGDPARRRLVTGKTHDMRGAIWGQAFEHGGRYHAGPRTAMGSLGRW